MAFTVWWLALSYLAFPRILFAWGMDRMGPKWFTDINPRYAEPGQEPRPLPGSWPGAAHPLLRGAAQHHAEHRADRHAGDLGVPPTAIAALWFPYSRRAKGVWDSSPYKKWTFLGLPVIVWGAAVDIFYLGILLYYFIVHNAATKTFSGPSLILFVGVWVAGIIWYYAWSAYNKAKSGMDISAVTYGELPPE